MSILLGTALPRTIVQLGGEVPNWSALGSSRLCDLVSWILQMQAEPRERLGRWYQSQILDSGGFEIPSLRTRGMLRADRSVLLWDKSVFYGFTEEPDLWLGATSLGEGFPILSVYIPSSNLFVNLGHPIWGAQVEQLDGFLNIVSRKGLEERWMSRASVSSNGIIVTGDASFAHGIWNQLSALDQLAGSRMGRVAQRVIVTREPIVPLRELFSDCPNWRFEFIFEDSLEELNDGSVMFVPIGGKFVTRAALSRIYACLEKKAELQTSLKRPSGLRFWISVRTRNRTLVNQIEFVAEAIAAMAVQYPGAEIVLDGHSLPADNAAIEERGDWSNQEIVEADRSVGLQILEKLDDQIRARVTWGIGLQTAQSLALARYCNFYVCHHGTVQHKVGWFCNCPGVAHGNEAIARSNPGPSVASHVEGGVAPTYLPAQMVKDATATDDFAMTEEKRALLHDNYLVDITSACNLIMEELRKALPVSDSRVVKSGPGYRRKPFSRLLRRVFFRQ